MVIITVSRWKFGASDSRNLSFREVRRSASVLCVLLQSNSEYFLAKPPVDPSGSNSMAHDNDHDDTKLARFGDTWKTPLLCRAAKTLGNASIACPGMNEKVLILESNARTARFG